MGPCFSKKDSQIQHTHSYSDEERVSPLPKHRLIGIDVSRIKIKDPLKDEDLRDLPRPESIDVSHYDADEATRQLDEFISNGIAEIDISLLSINSEPAKRLRALIIQEH